MRTEAKIWWNQAERDLKAARNSFKCSDYFVASFLAHQSVEKALKSLLIQRGLEFIRTHDLFFLAKRLNLPSRLVENCRNMSPIYIEARYPDANGEFKGYTKRETSEDLRSAQEVLRWIKKNF